MYWDIMFAGVVRGKSMRCGWKINERVTKEINGGYKRMKEYSKMWEWGRKEGRIERKRDLKYVWRETRNEWMKERQRKVICWRKISWMSVLRWTTRERNVLRVLSIELNGIPNIYILLSWSVSVSIISLVNRTIKISLVVIIVPNVLLLIRARLLLLPLPNFLLSRLLFLFPLLLHYYHCYCHFPFNSSRSALLFHSLGLLSNNPEKKLGN